jgi:hypothetical protein
VFRSYFPSSLFDHCLICRSFFQDPLFHVLHFWCFEWILKRIFQLVFFRRMVSIIFLGCFNVDSGFAVLRLECSVARWYILEPKILIWVNFGRSFNRRCWYFLWPIFWPNGIHKLRPYGTFCGNLLYNSCFGMLYREKSGNPVGMFLPTGPSSTFFHLLLQSHITTQAPRSDVESPISEYLAVDKITENELYFPLLTAPQRG